MKAIHSAPGGVRRLSFPPILYRTHSFPHKRFPFLNQFQFNTQPPHSDGDSMRAWLLMLLPLLISGCATPDRRPIDPNYPDPALDPKNYSARRKWPFVKPNDSRDYLVEFMGPPKEFKRTKSGREVLVWQIDRFEKCAAVLGPNGVEEKRCEDNAEARAAAASMMGAPMMPPPPMMQEPSFSPPTPIQTRCRSQWIMGVEHTDCTSQ